MMDPIGFALENFDGIGKWRTTQAGQKLDASGVLFDGTKINGVVDLRKALVRYSPQFVRVVTEKLMTYALGRGVDYDDMPVVRAIVREAEPQQLPFFVAGARHREERAVSDEPQAGSGEGGVGKVEGGVGKVGIGRENMFITKKHISRRTVLRGGGRLAGAAAARFHVPGAAALRQGRGAPKIPRFVGIFNPHGWAPEYSRLPSPARSANCPFDPQAARMPGTIRITVISGLDATSSMPPPGLTGGDHSRSAAVFSGMPPKKTVSDDIYRRHHHRPDDRAEVRPGNRAALPPVGY